MDSLNELDMMLADLSAGIPTSSKTEPPTEAAAAFHSGKEGISGHAAAATSPSTVESKPEIQKVNRRTSYSKTKGVDSVGVGEVNPSYVKREDLEGIVVKRVPLAEPDFETGEIKKLMEYQVHNTRTSPARLALEFSGTNIKIAPMGLASLLSHNVVTIMLAAGFSGSVATAAPASSKDEYSFSMNLRVTPVELKEDNTEELQGVILQRTVTHDDLTYVDFRVKNTRKFSVEVIINVVGNYKDRGFIPKMVLQAGEEASFGGVANDGDVSSSWQWKGLEPVDAKGDLVKPVDENKFDESELKGVFLGRVVFPSVDGAPGKIRFRGRNTLEKSVTIEVTVTGDTTGCGKVEKVVDAGSTEILGEVCVKGKMDIKWKWSATPHGRGAWRCDARVEKKI